MMKIKLSRSVLWCLLSGVLLLAGCDAKAPSSESTSESTPKWTSLFDGKTLGDWKLTEFAGRTEVGVEDGQLMIYYGDMANGITWSKPETLPRTNYEIELEAKRVEGVDFFCGLTFPIDTRDCSFILGGWGGHQVGLSSLDGMDASENETSQVITLNDQQWYHVRLRVAFDYVTIWLDGKEIIRVRSKGRAISIRPEVNLSRPLGICTWGTTAAFKNIRLRRVEQMLEHEANDEHAHPVLP